MIPGVVDYYATLYHPLIIVANAPTMTVQPLLYHPGPTHAMPQRHATVPRPAPALAPLGVGVDAPWEVGMVGGCEVGS